jgi:hypothetical protein
MSFCLLVRWGEVTYSVGSLRRANFNNFCYLHRYKRHNVKDGYEILWNHKTLFPLIQEPEIEIVLGLAYRDLRKYARWELYRYSLQQT